MSVQNVLDASALIAAGAASGEAGHYQGAGGITGIAQGWSRPPTSIQVGYTHVSFPPIDGDVDYDSANGLRETRYTITMRVFVSIYGPELQQATSDALPFIERYLTAFESHAKLTDLSGANPACSVATIGKFRFERGTYAAQEWLVLAFDLNVVEKPTVSFSV